MKIDKIIEEVINEVLEENEQPYKEEFKAFINHVMMDNYDEDELEERIKLIELLNRGVKK